MGYGARFLKKKEKEEQPVRQKQTAEEIYGMPEGQDLTRHLQNMGKLPKAETQNREATRKLIQYAPTQKKHQGYYQRRQQSRENQRALDNASRLQQMQNYRKQLSDRLYAPNSWDEKQIANQGAENWRLNINRQVETLDNRIRGMKQQQTELNRQALTKLREYQSPEVQQAKAEQQRQQALDRDRQQRLQSMEKVRGEIQSRLLYPTKQDLAEIDRTGEETWRRELQKDLDYLEGAIGKMKGQKGQNLQQVSQQIKEAKARELEDVLTAPDAEQTIAKAALKSQNLLGGDYQMRRAARYLTDPSFREKGQAGAPSLQQVWDWLTAGQAKENNPGQNLINGLKLMQKGPDGQTLTNGGAKEDLDFLTEQQKNTLLYYAGKGDWATMGQYYDLIERQVQQRRQQEANQWAEQQANQHKIAGAITNIGASLFSPLAYGEALSQTVKNKITGEEEPINTASPLMAGAQLAQATQRGIIRDMSPTGQFLTGTGLSIGQNLARMPLGPRAALGSMALGAAGSTALEATERGASAGQAATLGTLAGAAEALTEKLPLDNLFKLAQEGAGEGLRNFIKATLGQMGSEATEEVVSEYANRLADNIILSDQSEMAQYIRQLTEQGASKEQAEKAAALEFWVKQPALAGLGGALSGGIMGSGAQALNKINSFLQGPQRQGLPNAPGQGTIDQNELEAARNRFLRKEAQNGREIHEDDLRGNRSIAARGEEENLIRRNVGEIPAANVDGQTILHERRVESNVEGTRQWQPQRGGYRDEQVKDFLYRYKETPQERIVPEVQGVVDGFLKRGVKSIVFDSDTISESEGIQEISKSVSFTRVDGSTMVSSEAVNSGLIKQIVPHEMIHSTKKTNPARYNALEQKIFDIGIDINRGAKTLDSLAKGYGFDEAIPTVGSRFMEELLAQASGIYFDDPDFAREVFGPVFQDYDAVVAALEEFDAQSLREGRNQSSGTSDNDQPNPPSPPADGDSFALTRKGSEYLSRAADKIKKFLQGPQRQGLPNASGQGTIDQNELEAARNRFLRKEAQNGRQQGQEAAAGVGLRSLHSPNYDQGTTELETDNARRNSEGEGFTSALEEGTRRIPPQTRIGHQLGGPRSEQVGERIYHYEETPQEKIVPEVRQMIEEGAKRGARVVVFDGIPESEYEGKRIKADAVAFTRTDGTIMISSAAANSELRNQIIRHELLHSIKKTNPQRYQQLEQKVHSFDIYLEDETGVLSAINDVYGYDDLFSPNSRLLEETLAQLAGWHSEDPAFAREKFGPLFMDYDGVVAELEALDGELLSQNQIESGESDNDQANPPSPPTDGDSFALTRKGSEYLSRAADKIKKFLQGPQRQGLPNASGQGTIDQNELEAARNRFLRKEVGNGQDNQNRGGGGIRERLQGYQSGGEGLRQSQSFREEVSAFTHRAVEEGKRTEKIGRTTIAYRPTESQAITQRTREIQEFLENHGAEVWMMDDFAWNMGEQTIVSPEAVSLGEGKVALINGTEGNALEVGGHELCHLAEDKQKASRFIAATAGEAQDVFSETYIKYMTSIIESYFDDRGRTYDPSNPSHVEQVQREFRAYVAGALTADEAGARIEFADCFADIDEVVAGWQEALKNTERKGSEAQSENNSNDDILALTRKGSEYLSRAERRAADTIAKSMNIPGKAKRETLGPVLRDLAQQLASQGRLSGEAADSAFEAAYHQGLIVLNDFAEQYADLKRDLQRTRFQLSDQDKADIADYGDFRRRNMGRLNIVNQGGIPVDIKYQELAAQYPELFDPEITHPADQLLAIEEIRNQMDATEMSLSQYYGQDEERYKEFARYEFDRALEKLADEAAYVRRYEDDRAAKGRKTEMPAADIQAIKEAYQRNRQLAKASEKAASKYLLTEGDRRQIDRLLKGEITPEQLPRGANRQGILEVYQARKAQQENMEPVRQFRRQAKEVRLQRALELAEDADNWKDKKIGAGYSGTTPERAFYDVMGDKKGRAMIDEYIWPVHREEAEKIRLKNQLNQRIEQLNLSRAKKYEVTYEDPSSGAPVSGKVSESALVQLLGEKIISSKAVEACGADVAKIQGAVETFRQTYDELFGMAEDALIRNGYPPPGYIQGYFPHFQKNKPDGVWARILNIVGFGAEESKLPTEIAGQTHTFKPGKKWTPNLLERTGVQTEYDAIDGFDRYLQGISDVIYHTDNIQRLRALESALRYKFSDEGTKAEIDGVRTDSSLDEGTREVMLEALYQRDRAKLPNLVTWLRNYTDTLAGKKHPSDRQVEHELGRGYYEKVKKVEGRVAANMVGGNIGSALTNFIPITQSLGHLRSTSMFKALWDTTMNYSFPRKLLGRGADDGFVDGSVFLTNRRGAGQVKRGIMDKASGAAGLPMELIDNFTSEFLTRARYEDNLKHGMDMTEAMKAADEWAASLMGDRSKGAMPLIFEQKNPLIKALSMFQLEVNNQLQFILKDMPREAREKNKNMVLFMLWRGAWMGFGAWLWNHFISEPMTGRDSALDPASILMTAYQDFKDPDTKTSEALGNLGKNVAEQIPFVGGLMGGGRLPVSSALPDVTQLTKLLDKDTAPEKKWDIAQKELIAKPVAYLAMPFGGGQLKKSAEAWHTLAKGGSYARNSKGEEQLRFLTRGTAGDWIKGTLFGQYSLPEAQDYVTGGFKQLTAKQTTTVKEAKERGMDPQAVVDLIKELKKAQAEKDDQGQIIRTENQVKRRIIAKSSFDAADKSWLDNQLLSDGFFMKKEISADYSNAAALQLSEYGDAVLAKAREADSKAGVDNETFLALYEAQRGIESDRGKDGQAILLSKAKKRKEAIDKATPGLNTRQRRQVYEILGISEKVW